MDYKILYFKMSAQMLSENILKIEVFLQGFHLGTTLHMKDKVCTSTLSVVGRFSDAALRLFVWITDE